jgi:L-iditol 2-dehydrogenase
MKAMALYGKEDIREIEMHIPEPTGHSLVLKIVACGICGSDLRMYFEGPTPRYKLPIVLGHEIVAKVDRVGENVSDLSAGDLVTVAPIMPCMRCPACIRGDDNLCERGEVIGCTIAGGFSEYMYIPDQMVLSGGVVRIPQGINPISATMTEILSCCYHAISLVNFHAGDRVLIIGDGPIGLTFLQLTKFMGASLVVTSGRRQIRRELATKFGADETIDAKEEGSLDKFKNAFDQVIIATSNEAVVETAFEVTRPGGNILLFSGYTYGTKISLDPNKIHYREIQLHGSIDATIRDFNMAAKLLPKLNMADLISSQVKLSSVRDGFVESRSANVSKVIVVPD